jgi:primosomal protein N' (replication factor Y)
MIADVVFDLPLAHPFSYALPAGLVVRPGQRVRAPLAGRLRVGMVVAVREGTGDALRPVERAVESAPILSAAALELCRWAAEESLSSWGATVLSLVPPPPKRADLVAPPPPAHPGAPGVPELWVDAGRDERLAKMLRDGGAALVITPDIEAAARWAAWVDAARLDSGATAGARRAAWFAAARGRVRTVVGTRSALLVPLPPPATVALVDEHDPGHKPPGAPRLHTREIVMRRASLESSRVLLLSATPSAETWWRCGAGLIRRRDAPAGPWPEIVTADTRGILRNHPLTLPLTRAIERSAREARRVALIVSRRASSLLCGECGHVLRCPECGVALAALRAGRALRCRLCVRTRPTPDRCPGCGGHRLAPFGWDAERVEASVRRRFPRVAVSRTDPRATVLIGPASLLTALRGEALGAVGIVALDAVLSAPDFRAGERAFALLWAAAEAVAPAGRVVVQTLLPGHYAVEAARAQARERFYDTELEFRSELGYPPFRRLCLVSAQGRSEAEARAGRGDCIVALAGVPGLKLYPPAAGPATPARGARWHFTIKGPPDVPRLVAGPLAPFLAKRRRGAPVVEVEVDPS